MYPSTPRGYTLGYPGPGTKPGCFGHARVCGSGRVHPEQSLLVQELPVELDMYVLVYVVVLGNAPIIVIL